MAGGAAAGTAVSTAVAGVGTVGMCGTVRASSWTLGTGHPRQAGAQGRSLGKTVK